MSQYPSGPPVHTLVLGGARSGKSAFALQLAERHLTGDRKAASALFVATASVRDQEMQERITIHRAERGSHWHTVEEEIEIGEVVRRNSHAYQVVLVDCLTLWVSNMLLEASQDLGAQTERLEEALSMSKTPVILVSNEVGLGIVPDNPLARQYRDELGRVNQRFARLCPRVIFMAAGLPMVLKGPGI